MKTHTQEYKNKLKSLGKEIDAIITIDGTELTAEHINSANLHYEGNILKSVMKQLDLVLDQEIAKNTQLNFKFGIKVNDAYEYIDYGTFIVKDIEKQEDTNTYKITCYDKMLYSMKDYEALDITYPISVRNYIKALCTKLGLGFKNENNTFANYDKMIQQELYLDSDGNSLGYKYRDVFDELAQATASTICLDENDEVEIRYVDDVINETQSVEGTDIVLTDSEEAPLQGFEVKGNIEQETTTQSANLFDEDYYNNDSLYQNNVYRYVETTFKANGQRLYTKASLKSGKTAISGLYMCISTTPNPNASGGAYSMFIINGQINNGNFAPSQGTTLYFSFYPTSVNVSTIFDTYNIWVRSTTDGGYVPFVPNSPSPNYPQPIKNITGRQEVDIVGKNYFHDYTNDYTARGVSVIKGENSVILNGTFDQQANGDWWLTASNNSTYTNNMTLLKANTEYTISVEFVSGSMSATGVNCVLSSRKVSDKSFSWNYKVISLTQSGCTYTFTPTEDVYLGAIRLPVDRNKACVFDNLKIRIQLEESSAKTEYEPYKGNTYEINLGKNMYIGSQDFSGTWNNENQWITDSETYNGLVVKKRNSAWNGLSKDISLKSGKTYTFSLFAKSDVSRPVAIYIGGGITNISTKDFNTTTEWARYSMTFVCTTDGVAKIRLENRTAIADSYTYICGYQLEQGSQATPYSKYFTPIELNEIGTYQDEIFRNKNLLDYKATPTTYNCTYQYTNNGIRIITNGEDYDEGLSIPVRGLVVGQKYYARINITSMTPSGDDNWLWVGLSNATYSQSIETNETGEFYLEFTPTQTSVGFGIYGATETSIDFTIEDLYIGRVNEYIPYGEEGKWYLYKEIGKVIYTGASSEGWAFNGNQALYVSIGSVNGKFEGSGTTTQKILSNYYTSKPFNYLYDRSNDYGISYGSTSADRICIRNKDITTVADFKTWLSTHNTIVYYVLATPTDTEITNDNYPELLSQLKALDKAQTLEGYTSITSSFPLSLTYVSEYEAIDEEFVKNTRASFEETYGPINSIVLSRSADSDNVYIQDEASIEENGLTELKISDNQILNGNDRDTYLQGLLDRLDGLTFNTNDFESVGITYLELCDRYRVKVRDNKYKCVMFNDEIEIKSGLNEIIYTDMPQETQTDYSKADKTDRKINKTYIIADKQQGEITALVNKTNNLDTQEKNNYQAILTQLGNYATNSRVQEVETEVQNIQTDTYTRTEVNQILKGTFYDEDNNQIVSEVVKTTSGTFDENGMLYEKTNAKTSTRINEVGVKVQDTISNDELLFAGYDDNINQTIVRADNMTTRNFLVVGQYSRFQDYQDGTGVFDI